MMDPKLHDTLLYVQTLAWSAALVLGVLFAFLLLAFVGETVEHFTQ